MAAIRRCVDLIGPDRIQLNTVTRPPAERYATAVPRARLHELAASFSPPAEVIAEFHSPPSSRAGHADLDEILRLLRRRPCSTDDIADGLGMHRNEVLKWVEHLERQGLVEVTSVAGQCYYRPSGQAAQAGGVRGPGMA
jgi:biotin operon repressor